MEPRRSNLSSFAAAVRGENQMLLGLELGKNLAVTRSPKKLPRGELPAKVQVPKTLRLFLQPCLHPATTTASQEATNFWRLLKPLRVSLCYLQT